jgi:hypothetical protein
MKQPGFAFILNLLRFDGSLPVELIPGVRLNHANLQQTELISDYLSRDAQFGGIGGLKLYLQKPVSKMPEGSWNIESLPPEEVHFWVLECDDLASISTLKTALLLIEPEIEWSAQFYPSGRSVELQTAFQFFHTHLYPVFDVLTESTFEEARWVLDALRHLHSSEPEAEASIRRVLADYQSSRSYIRIGHMAFLNHFALIEALVTHDPKSNAGDSLNHQISTKLPLLFRRFRVPPDPKKFFQIDALTDVWKCLYEARSRYAHGAVADFTTGKMSKLVSFEQASRFTHLTLKEIFKLALREPDLLSDLKRC